MKLSDDQRWDMIWLLHYWCYQDQRPAQRMMFLYELSDSDLGCIYAEKKLQGEIKPFND